MKIKRVCCTPMKVVRIQLLEAPLAQVGELLPDGVVLAPGIPPPINKQGNVSCVETILRGDGGQFLRLMGPVAPDLKVGEMPMLILQFMEESLGSPEVEQDPGEGPAS